MFSYFVMYIATAVVFLALDSVWLGVIAKDFYFTNMDHLLAENVNFGIAAGFYLFYAVGIVIFAVNPAVTAGDWTKALLFGALFGFFCYATYDFTNMATLKDWPVKVSIVDVLWGTSLTAIASVAGYAAVKAFIS